MKSMHLSPGLRRHLPLIALVSVVLLLLLALGLALLDRHDRYQKALASVEPRYARMAGLQNSAGELEASVVKASKALSGLAFPASTDAGQAGTELQQVTRRAIDRLGLSLVSSQIMPPEAQDAYEEISVSVVFEGSLEQVQGFFVSLADEQPAIVVKSAQLSSRLARVGRTQGDATDSGQRINARVTIAAMRIKTP